LRSKSYLFLLLVVGLGILSAFIYSRFPYKLGLDVQGGVRFVYQMDTAKLTPEQRSNLGEVRSKIQTILVNRASGAAGVAEPLVAAKGEDQFIIEIPAFTDINEARGILGTSARIEFYHAKNLKTAKFGFRPYSPVEATGDNGNPIVHFQRDGASGDIKPGDPEYASIIRGWDLILSGDDLARAEASPVGSGYQPLMYFSGAGGEKINVWSRKYQNDEEYLAAVLDGRVLSVAPLQRGAVLRENAIINGTFEAGYVRNLVSLLNAGSLPVDLKELSSEKVDPTIGKQALDKIVFAGMVAFVATAIFLIVYYAFPGLMALIALLLYILFTLTALKFFGATFSLAAIAGFILSIGMAVDANILVFERFKEEMKAGRSLTSAIELGFRRALPAIVDSNACTIMTSFVLYQFGTGPVKGFATTLIIGVLISLFTAITVTRSLLLFVVGSGIGTNPKLYALGRNWFGEKFEETANEKPFPVLQKTKRWLLISLATIVVGMPFIFLGGLKGNVEFRGGYEATYAVGSRTINSADLARTLDAADIEGANVKFGGEGANRFVIVTASRDGALKDLSEAEAINRLTQASGFTGADLRGSSSVGPAIQRETIQNALYGVVISALLIIVYLSFRFGFGLGGFGAGIKFGFSAIGALVHDVLVVLGITAMTGYFLGWEISALFLTSMLTVIGFSVHDTIVVFDRIRENLTKPLPNEDFQHLVNRSVTQSFARSINTGITVIATLLILLFLGTTTPDLKLFCVTMLAGILSGTYSSLYNASPILWLWDKATMRKHGEEAGFMALARAEAAKNRTIVTQAAAAMATTGTTSASGTTTVNGRTYGQVKRKVRASDRAKQNLDDE